MKHPAPAFSRLYKSALREHLSQSRPSSKRMEKLRVEARAAGLPVLALAGMHEQIILKDLLPDCPAAKRGPLIRNAGGFFATFIQTVDRTETPAHEASRVNRTIKALSSRNIELAATNQGLEQKITAQEKVATALRESEHQVTKSLEKSESLKEQIRRMSRQILSVQEDERKRISRELHDVVAQALVGINARLATLKAEAGMNVKGLARNITKTQKMISKSTEIVHKFARELRPAALDDLGLVPTLRSLMKCFTTRTGVRTHLTAFVGIEDLDAMRRTILYRIAQEALTNVGRHACASHVWMTFQKDGKFVLMEVRDDGVSFEIQEMRSARRTKRLGLIGMRERAEMVRGSLEIESTLGSGTIITARIPVNQTTEARWSKKPARKAPPKP